MSRPVGNLNKATIRREMAKRRAAHLLEQVDTMYALDALAVLQEVMSHFYHKAKVLKGMGENSRTASDTGRGHAGCVQLVPPRDSPSL